MKEKLKIGYFADGPWGHNALKLLLNDESVEVCFVVPRNDTKDMTLKELALEGGVDYIEKVFINSDEFYEQAKAYDCDLFVSMSYNQIFRERIINLPRLKTINCHAGKLPFYRGRNILNWVLINDENEFGITVHYIDEGIDTGDIILQRTFPITDSDTYGTLLEVAHTECANVLYDGIKKIQEGTSERIDQTTIHPVGFYCGLRGIGDEMINWNQSSRDLFNFIRAVSSPGPKARTFVRGTEISINKSREIPGAPVYKSTVGQIVGKTEEGFVVKTQDSTIEILEVESSIKLKIGDRFSHE